MFGKQQWNVHRQHIYHPANLILQNNMATIKLFMDLLNLWMRLLITSSKRNKTKKYLQMYLQPER